MCLAWMSRKSRSRKIQPAGKGTLSPSWSLLPLGTRTELVGWRPYKRDKILFITKNLVILIEKNVFLMNQRKTIVTETCAILRKYCTGKLLIGWSLYKGHRHEVSLKIMDPFPKPRYLSQVQRPYCILVPLYHRIIQT